MSIEVKFTGETVDDVHKSIASYLAYAGNGTVTLGGTSKTDPKVDVADAAGKAAGSTAVTVKPTAAEKKAAKDAEAKAAAEAAAEATKAADDDLLGDDTEDEAGDVEKTYDIEDLRKLLPDLKAHPKAPEDVLAKLIAKHGGKKLTGVPAENHTAMYLEAEAMLKKLG